MTNLIPRPQVEKKSGLKRSEIYERMAKGLFPRPVHLSPKAVRWVEREIDAWVTARIAERDGAQFTVLKEKAPPAGWSAGLRVGVLADELNTPALTPDQAEFQAQRDVLVDWADEIAAKARRLFLCGSLGLIRVGETEGLLAEIAHWRDAIIILAAMRRSAKR